MLFLLRVETMSKISFHFYMEGDLEQAKSGPRLGWQGMHARVLPMWYPCSESHYLPLKEQKQIKCRRFCFKNQKFSIKLTF